MKNEVANYLVASTPGYAFTSKRTEEVTDRDEIVVSLPKSQSRALILKDLEGKPIPLALVHPFKRTDRLGNVHVFSVQNKPFETADDEGRVTIDWFAAGDEARITCLGPFAGFAEEFKIEGDPDKPIEVIVKPRSIPPAKRQGPKQAFAQGFETL